MVELNPNESKILQALKDLYATAPDKAVSVEKVEAATKMSKGMVGSTLASLCNKNLVKKILGHKASNYYVMPEKPVGSSQSSILQR